MASTPSSAALDAPYPPNTLTSRRVSRSQLLFRSAKSLPLTVTTANVVRKEKTPSSASKEVVIVGQQPPQSRRRSILGTGRDILKRQSLLGKSNSPAISPTSARSDDVHESTSSAPNRARFSLPVDPMVFRKGSSTMLHAQAVAAVAPPAPLSAQAAVPQPYLHIDTDLDEIAYQESICHSPTWRDEKSKKKQSGSGGWNWKKASNGKPKKDDTVIEQQPVKQPKKLNKRPPAAMDTQRQSTTLTNGIPKSEAPQMERRPSSSGSLTQAMRGFLSRRSSQSSPEVSRPASGQALRSQSQEPTVKLVSRRDSIDKSGKDEDDEYVDDLAEFGRQMNASARAALNAPESRNIASIQSTTFPAPLSTPPGSSGKEAEVPTEQRAELPRSISVPSTISRIFGKKDNAAGGYKYPDINNKLANGTRPGQAVEGRRTNSNDNLRTKSTTDVRQRNGIPGTGSGYVQRERMVNQQRSIARFQDEIAVTSAYDTFLGESQLPPTPQDSSESVETIVQNGFHELKQEQRSSPGNDTRLPETHRVLRPQPSLEHRRPSENRQINGHYTPTAPTRANDVPSYKTTSNTRTIAEASPPIQLSIRPQPVQSLQSAEKTPQVVTQKSPEKKPFWKVRSSHDTPRPASVAVQPSSHESRKQSLPQVPQPKSDELMRHSKESSLALTSASTGSTSSVLTRKISSTFQLPPLSSSPTSPIFAGFGETGSDGHSSSGTPPVDSTTQLTPSPGERKVEPLVPISTATAKTELLIASENAEGILRKTSVKRHKSDPELRVPELKVDPVPRLDIPSFDFLPELKHQPLSKPKRTSRVSFAPGAPQIPLSPSQFPVPSTTNEIARRGGGGPLRTSKRTQISSSALTKAGPPKPVAKMFVICCKCKFWHDLPSKIYEAMALPQAVGKDDDIAAGMNLKKSGNKGALPEGEVKGLEGKIFTQVKCPWCDHGMSTSCCEGWTAVIYLHEKHH